MHENYNQPQLEQNQENPFDELAERRAFLEKVKEATFYEGFFVDREELYRRAPAHLEHSVEKPHVTTKFAPDVPDLHLEQLGDKVKIVVIGYANNGKNEGFLVRIESDDPGIQAIVDRIRNPHITLSYSEGSHPKDTIDLNFQPLRKEEQFELTGTYCLHLKDDRLVDNEKELFFEEETSSKV